LKKQSQFTPSGFSVLRSAKGNLKKQSQSFDVAQDRFCSFIVLRAVYCEEEFEKTNPIGSGQNGVSSYLKGRYDNIPSFRAQKNKANSKPNLTIYCVT
jgi:hypothetical protein